MPYRFGGGGGPLYFGFVDFAEDSLGFWATKRIV
jgi:hypothetical protein